MSEETNTPASGGGFISRIRFAAVLAVIFGVLIIALQNTETSEVSLFVWRVQLPQFMLFVALFGGGFLTGAAALFLVQKRRGR